MFTIRNLNAGSEKVSNGNTVPAFQSVGQMTDDGTLTYSWDRGGPLLSAGGSSYAYNGLGNRLSQTVSAVVTDYLLDLQPGLSKVLAAATSGNTTRYVHDPRGLHSQQQSNGDWVFPITDGLNSVRRLGRLKD